jgi:hypothetical protein
MSREQIIERERRWAAPAAVAAFLAIALYAGAIAIEQGGDLIAGDNDAAQLRSVDENSGLLLVASVVRGVGFLLLCAPLLYLFAAVRARNERVPGALAGLAFIGPLLLAVQGIASWAASTELASDFVANMASTGPDAERLADDLIDESSGRQAAAGLLFSGVLAMLVALFYIPRQAMRAGLLPRFWATLGMALGVSLILIVPIALMMILLWFGYLGLLYLGRLPGGRPPAWAAGEAVPWPTPGEQAAQALEPEETESAEELPAGDEPETAADVPGGPGPDPRKRKRRR